ncbi:hypothetical protein AG0111_0g10451 [Alternaria gaisen]|uniref:Uncharacterized protein n=1 Tax=Alternaria gaisen TaxID=167740 RepID=A0ACB6FB88_9PLEO|nr:hypothetical protein AG0111_0g10451 [Alternaria gaisen]
MAISYARDQPQGFTNRIENVAIVGAGGQFGKYLTEALLKTGKHTVTAITRTNSTNSLPEGVRIERVDYSGDDLDALVDALRGQQVLIVTMAIMAPRDAVSKLFGHDAANKKLCDDSMLSPSGEAIHAEIEILGVSANIRLVCNFRYKFSLGGGPDRFSFEFTKRSLIVFDEGDVSFNVSTWAQCARAVANLFSLKQLPEDESDNSPTLSQFGSRPVYISSFRLSQMEMFEVVKRVTSTSDDDWTITHESSEERRKDGFSEVMKGSFRQFTNMLYSRMYFPSGGGDYEPLDDNSLSLPVEDLDQYTAISVRMGENGEVPQVH